MAFRFCRARVEQVELTSVEDIATCNICESSLIKSVVYLTECRCCMHLSCLGDWVAETGTLLQDEGVAKW